MIELMQRHMVPESLSQLPIQIRIILLLCLHLDFHCFLLAPRAHRKLCLLLWWGLLCNKLVEVIILFQEHIEHDFQQQKGIDIQSSTTQTNSSFSSFLFTDVFAFGVAALIAGGSAGSAGTTPTGSAIAIAAATSNRAPVASAGTSAGMGKPFSWHAVVFSNFLSFKQSHHDMTMDRGIS